VIGLPLAHTLNRLICLLRHQIRALVAAFALGDEDELNGQIGSKRRRHVPKAGSGWQTVNFSAAAAGHLGADVLLDEPGPPGVSHAASLALQASTMVSHMATSLAPLPGLSQDLFADGWRRASRIMASCKTPAGVG
jgi:hypothetical protein